ncbi:MAG TPA: hypothetical protein VGH28_23425 [Polyangiaceae bacterium]|jgi:hypothetical protein
MRNVLWVALATLSVGCGGAVSDGADGGDSGTSDGSTSDAPTASDAAPGSDGSTLSDGGAPSPYDGTVGKACSTDSDCASPNGPNQAKCSNTVFPPTGYYPTPICIIPSCAPVSGNALHFCDGPDDPSSPGICVPGAGGNYCVPKCTYDKNGGAASGCTGKDTCFTYPSVNEDGVGYCWGGCKTDQDCASGHCQADQGICVQGVTPPTKNIGDACTKTDNDTLACYCLYGNSGAGYCSSLCVVGQNGGCPSGYVCDPFEYRADGYTKSNDGMAGYCTKDCSGDASACPASASCTNLSASGPDCVPP